MSAYPFTTQAEYNPSIVPLVIGDIPVHDVNMNVALTGNAYPVSGDHIACPRKDL